MRKELRFLKNVSWGDVFRVWKSQEGSAPSWREVAREKGWSSWEAWRGNQAEKFGCSEKEWKLYEILKPNEIIPKFRVGPFKVWQADFQEKNKHTFEDFARTATEKLRKNGGVARMPGNFPFESQMIGIFFERTNEIILFEGHHRAAAVALAVHDGKPIDFSALPKIALASVGVAEEEEMMWKLDEAMKRGTENPNRKKEA